jgi:ribose/xylose/arabinose/galactoside ABC-type transport system permease subunit
MPVSETVSPDEPVPVTGVPRGVGGLRPTRALTQASSFTARYAVWIALAIVVIAGVVSTPLFLTASNVTAILQNISILGIVAVGQTLVIAGGAMDLSTGMLMGLIVVVTNGTMNGDPQLALPVIALGLGIGLLVGIINGVLLVLTRIHPLILTFGTLSVLQGVIFIYTDKPVGSGADNFRQLAQGMVGPLPVPFLMLALTAVTIWVILNRTTLGSQILATGAGEVQARRAGIPVSRIRLVIFAVSGLTAAIAGLVLSARLGSGTPLAGAAFGLDAIVAVVLGGTPFTGGRSSVAGTVAGVTFLVVLGNVLNLAGVSAFTQQVLKGAVIIGAVALYARPRRTLW